MRILLPAIAVLAFILFFPAPALAQTNLLTNGSFESGLTGWTQGQQLEAGATGTCGYNATTGAGTETTTGQPAFPPTDGTQLAHEWCRVYECHLRY